MATSLFELNHRAAALCGEISGSSDALQIARSVVASGTTLFDFGIEASGSVEAGLMLARVCLADLATVRLVDGDPAQIEVTTEQPVAACMASQYAGWEVKGDKFFAMGSGPMRAAAGREPLV